jgi:hypothetical protein
VTADPQAATVPAKPASARTVRLAGRAYPLVLPSVRDPRLHLASVIISIHVLGQIALGFQVSVVQILVAILTCAVVEVAWTFLQTRAFVWPASAMLTGSGVALIFRVIGTEHGDTWSWRGWYLFALVAGLSLVTKYVVKVRGSHVFNPSNVGLVVAFLLLGSSRVEPLDFWWAPLDGWMVLAYAIILGGGIAITRRLHLLGMSVAFWLTLAAGIGVLASSGHCMTARWSFAPVCGMHFWWIILTSPEILVFLFFMITDPKTVPAGRVARVVFGVSVGVVSTLLIAPQSTEFGAKVGLLSGLVVMSVARLPFARAAQTAPDEDRLGVAVARFAADGGAPLRPRRALVRGAVAGAALVFLSSGIVAAGTPAREPETIGDVDEPIEIVVDVDPSLLPRVTVDPEVVELSAELAGEGAQDVALVLAENLEVEAQALLQADPELLAAVDTGPRLEELRARIDAGRETGRTVVDHYRFDELHLVRAVPSLGQSGLALGFEAGGTVESLTYDADGDQVESSTTPFAVTFVLGQPTGERWLIMETQPLA